MESELIVIGDELLDGRVVDSNSAFIAQRLVQLGIRVGRVIRVGDDVRAIRQAIAESLIRTGLIIVTGGLGPTADDCTLEAVCGLIERPLVLNRTVMSRMRQFFAKKGSGVPRKAIKQAFVPEGSTIFLNPSGFVPGMVLEHQGRVIILIPGVPEEVKALFSNGIEKYLKERFSARSGTHTVLIRTCGTAEARVASRIERILRRFPAVSVGYYPVICGLDLVFSGQDEDSVKCCADLAAKILGKNVYARDQKNLPEVLGDLLRRQHLTIATAESCTGGLVGDLITSVPGSSDYFLGGIIAYANDIKISLLGVRRETLERFGAVSQQTVREMLIGAVKVTGADCAVAISGIAGPGGGTKTKPVGLVYIGALAGQKKRIQRHLFSGTRSLIKQCAAWSALDQLRRLLSE